MADIDLPVFSFRPNWANGVNERLSFLTQVLKGEEGAEQRRPLRLTPRRTIEADFLLSGAERTFYDLFLHKMGALEVTIPLYWDIGRTTAPAVATVTDRLEFDTRWTEFAAGLAIIQGKTALDYEVVTISAVDDDGIDLATPVTKTWPMGSRVMPLRRALIEDMGSLGHHSAKVATVSAQFALTVANPRTVPADPSTVYKGLPVFKDEPNWVEPLDVQLARDGVRLDNQSGLPWQVDPTGRANVGQAHRWFLHGRESLALFRDMLYRRKGRTGSFWLPTFKGDLTLAANAGSGATQIVVENVGLNYCNVPTSGRDHIAIHLKDGTTILRQITDVDPGDTSATEKIDLDSPVGLALSPGQVRKISFLDTAHFDQDDFDLTHFTDSKGLTDVAAVFRTFKNSRVPATPIHYPIPTVEMENGVPCGVDIPSDCYEVPWFPTFEGWFLRLRYVMYRNAGPLENSFQDTDPINVVWASENIDFNPETDNWIETGPNSNVGIAAGEANRPVQKICRYDGQPYTPWFTANTAYLETVYWNTGAKGPEVANTFAAIEAAGQVVVYYQKQHGSTTIAAGTRGYFEYLWWDGPEAEFNTFTRVPQSAYIQDDGYPVDGAGTFQVPGLWPVDRIFVIPRPA